MIATGHSQSAGRLRTYYNAVQPLSSVLDAVVLHGGGGVCAPTSPRRCSASTPRATSPAASAPPPAQPDSPRLRTWEVAGASHGDWKLITDYGPLRKRDIGTYPGGYPGEPQTCALPSLSRVPQHMVQNAVYDHTVTGSRTASHRPPRRRSPPTSPRHAVARDGLGLALGGIRLASTRCRCGSTAA